MEHLAGEQANAAPHLGSARSAKRRPRQCRQMKKPDARKLVRLKSESFGMTRNCELIVLGMPGKLAI